MTLATLFDGVKTPVTLEIRRRGGNSPLSLGRGGFKVVAVAHPANQPDVDIGDLTVVPSSDGHLACPEEEGGLQADCHYEVAKFRRRYMKYLRSGRDLLCVRDAGIDYPYRGEGLGVAMYIVAVREASRRGALLIGNTCEEGGQTSQEADRVWGSRQFRDVADVEGWVAFVDPTSL
jgi:predicted GNAT family acetyltransferase